MSVRTDPLLSVFGRYEGRTPGAPAIMLGSHIDTVVDAGLYDGNLGVLAAIAAVAELRDRGERLHHAIEVAAFGEEEGSRFPTHILTSSALIGAVEPELLDVRDADGITVREALARAGGDAEAYRDCARTKGEIAAFLELHIEQGPVLEARGAALAAVTAHQRLGAVGRDGHGLCRPRRHRAHGLAARCACRGERDDPGRGAHRRFRARSRRHRRPRRRPARRAERHTRSRHLHHRHAQPLRCRARPRARGARGRRSARSPGVAAWRSSVDTYQRNAATALDPIVIDAAAEAIAACGQAPLRLASGAGHDAMIMARHCPSGMIFVRCKDGISHNPAESITVEDADLGVRALLEAVRRWTAVGLPRCQTLRV